jgi:hypothetical protein
VAGEAHMECNEPMCGSGTRVPDLLDNRKDSGGGGGCDQKGDHDGDSMSSDWELWQITQRRERISAEPRAHKRHRRWSLMRADGVPAGRAFPNPAAVTGATSAEAVGWAQPPRQYSSPGPVDRPEARRSFSHVEDELESMTFVVRIAEFRDGSRHTIPAMRAMPTSDSMKQAVGALLESGKALLSRTASEPIRRRSRTSEFGLEQIARPDTAQLQSARISSVSSTASAAASRYGVDKGQLATSGAAKK